MMEDTKDVKKGLKSGSLNYRQGVERLKFIFNSSQPDE